MKFGSLFSGIGGFDLGLERAGMRCSWQVERDPYCLRVLAKHWPDVPRHHDIKELDRDDFAGLDAVDLVCGGPPCQPASLAGKRRGADDDRWLWPETLRCVAALRPAWCLFENPLGFVTLGLDGVLSELEGLDYAVWPLVIPAVAVDAPHRRSRVWILANSNSVRELQQAGEQSDKRRWAGHGVRWASECEVSRMDYGVPSWVGRVFGNAVVPQVVAEIGWAIMTAALGESV